MSQIEVLNLLKKSEKLCSKDVAEVFNSTRQWATKQLVKLEKLDKVVGFYTQERIGNNIYTIKYYKYLR